MANLEYVIGQESHSSYWGKFYIKGLESFEIKEDFEENRRDKHASYQGYVSLDIPENTIFTLFYQDGDKRGTDEFWFLILVANNEEINKIKAPYGSGFITGNFKSLADAKTKTQDPRLMGWWTGSKDHSLEFAEHCKAHIDKRGLKDLPSL